MLLCYWICALAVLVPSAGLAQARRAAPPPWSAGYPQVDTDVASGKPLTLLVVVPLCDSKLIACGGQGAGDPGSLDQNLYWGRAFGARRHFDEQAKQFQRVARQAGAGPLLEQLVYRRLVPGARWGTTGPVEQLVVLRAIHGERIDDAVRDFYRFATQGAEVAFVQDGVARRVSVHVTGYAGHNRLMDGVGLHELAAAPSETAAAPLPSFVFACRSAPYFSEALSQAGSKPLVMTRDLMAPEGYIIEAMARGLGDRASIAELRRRVVATYARWQRISERTASSIFAKTAPE